MLLVSMLICMHQHEAATYVPRLAMCAPQFVLPGVLHRQSHTTNVVRGCMAASCNILRIVQQEQQ